MCFALACALTTLPLAGADGELEPLPLKLPHPKYFPTPMPLPKAHLDPADVTNKGLRRPVFLAPKGITNVALNKPVTSSDPNPIIGDLSLVTDGDAESMDGHAVELSSGKQWVQIDLGSTYEIYAIVFWHRFDVHTIVFHDVVVQTGTDAAMGKNVTTLFNNDLANDVGLGAGKDFQYIETNQGKLVDGKGTKARYVRLYSKGSTVNSENAYTEVQVFAVPATK